MTASLHVTRGPPRAAVERLVVHAARQVQPLAALTPANAPEERARLVDDLRARRPARPRWVYAPACHDELRRAIEQAVRVLEASAEDAVDRLYLERLVELDLEASLCAAAGGPALGPLARARYAPLDAREAKATATLCASWIGEAEPFAPQAPVASDDPDPRSLLSRMRAAVGSARLPFTVVVHGALASLAATGDGVIFVAPGRAVTEDDGARTVLHEIVGHARPRARAAEAALAIFRAGTARGIDDQEGRALLLEQRAGLLGPRRRRLLAARHRAFERMAAGATFTDVTAGLVRDHAVEPLHAVLIAERAFRGTDGARPGLGRERVYLESFVRVGLRFAARPDDERVLAAGQIAVAAAPALRAFVA